MEPHRPLHGISHTPKYFCNFDVVAGVFCKKEAGSFLSLAMCDVGDRPRLWFIIEWLSAHPRATEMDDHLNYVKISLFLFKIPPCLIF